MKTYEYHPLASLLPLLDDEDFNSLVEDIREYGQIEPITLFEGKILDGRNRYKACLELGIEVKVKEWMPSELNGLTPLQYVISENIMRRHLNTAQRAEIGLILLPEIEEEAKKRTKEMAPLKRQLQDPNLTKNGKKILVEKIAEIAKGEQSSSIAGRKVKIDGSTLQLAKKVAEVAETEPLIKEEWEKAKQGEQGVAAVYEKAKVIEEIKSLPQKEQNHIKKVIATESASKVKEVVEEAKKEQQRREDAEKFRQMEKQKQEMAQLLKTIESYKNKIETARNNKKQAEAKLEVLSGEVISKYPAWENKDPSNILTQLSLLYDSLDTSNFNDQLSALRQEYEAKIQPLRDQIKRLEGEFATKKKEITESKAKVESEIRTIERYEDLMNDEFNAIDRYEEEMSENGERLKELMKEYDTKYK